MSGQPASRARSARRRAAHDVFEVVEIVPTAIARVRSPFLFEIGEELRVRIEQDRVFEVIARVRAHVGPVGPDHRARAVPKPPRLAGPLRASRAVAGRARALPVLAAMLEPLLEDARLARRLGVVRLDAAALPGTARAPRVSRPSMRSTRPR